MKQRIMNNVGVLVALGIFLSFLAASGIMYDKYNSYMQQDVEMYPSAPATSAE